MNSAHNEWPAHAWRVISVCKARCAYRQRAASDHVTQAIKLQRTACCSSYHSVTTKKNAKTWSRSRAWNNGSARPEACYHGCYPICIIIPSQLSYSLTLTFWVGREPCFAGVARVAGPSEDGQGQERQAGLQADREGRRADDYLPGGK